MQKKKGISLIVLVITIIVMIILAAAVIIVLDNAGVINKANDAIDANDLQQVQELATIAWADAFAGGKRSAQELKAVVDQALIDNHIDTNKYDVIVDEKGVTVTILDSDKATVPKEWRHSVSKVTVDDVPIPIGFVQSPYDGEKTKDEGLVIYELAPTEIPKSSTIDIEAIDGSKAESRKKRNQFVWVPVDPDEFEDKFIRVDHTGRNGLSDTLGSGYWELILEENMPADATKNTSTYMSAYTLQEATEMYQSVKKYGGFYIARYEVGGNTYNETNFLR